MLNRILAIVVLCPLGLWAQAAPVDPLTLTTRDAHQDLTIAADPYISADRYDGQFGKKSPYEAGIVAIQVYFRNNNDAPIRVSLETMRLVVSPPGIDRQRLEPLTPEDVADRTVLTGHVNPSRPHVSLPGSASRSTKNKAWTEMAQSLRTVALASDILPPHATTHGFIFFDLDHDFTAIQQSTLYIPDLSFMTNHKALFFFEINLATLPAK
jgi:hypothetical protein